MRLTAGEFGRYCEQNCPKSIFMDSEDQEWNNGICAAFRLTFSSLQVLNNPNTVFLKGNSGMLQLNGVKYVDVDRLGVKPNTLIRVVCGIYGTEKFDKDYILVATS